MKKIVGIIARKRNFNNKDYLIFNKELVDIIYKNNFKALGILLDFKNDDYKDLINLCDGIILQGGMDTYDIDNDIVRYLYEKDIPTLGICLGMQLMGNAFNGEIKSIESLNHDRPNGYVHKINIMDSKLKNILSKDTIWVNSRHQDNLIKTDLSVTAHSEDGVIEAIEDKNKKFFIGIQWHPESINDENSRRIFGEFFNEIKKLP